MNISATMDLEKIDEEQKINVRCICREAFKIFDRNKDGMISLQELKKVTDILGTVLSKEEVDEFMKEADKV